MAVPAPTVQCECPC